MYRELVLQGDRIVVQQTPRERVRKLAREGHQGIVKTKSTLRSKVWWPKMDKEAERLFRVCHSCQMVGDAPAPESMARSKPTGPWQGCAADLLGPIREGG